MKKPWLARIMKKFPKIRYHHPTQRKVKLTLSLLTYNFDFKASILEWAFFCSSVSFKASPMLPWIFTFPWKNACCGFSLPEIKSNTSSSFMVNVTSGFSEKKNRTNNENWWINLPKTGSGSCKIDCFVLKAFHLSKKSS